MFKTLMTAVRAYSCSVRLPKQAMYTFMYFGWPRRGSLLRGLIFCPSMLKRCRPCWSGLQRRLPHIEVDGRGYDVSD